MLQFFVLWAGKARVVSSQREHPSPPRPNPLPKTTVGGALRSRHRPGGTQPPPRPSGHSPFPACDLELVVDKPSVSPALLSYPRHVDSLVTQRVSPRSSIRLSLALPRGSPSPWLRETFPGGTDRGHDGAADSPLPPSGARAHPGTPRHITDRDGRLGKRARPGGMGSYEGRVAGTRGGTGSGRAHPTAATSPGCRTPPRPGAPPRLHAFHPRGRGRRTSWSPRATRPGT